MTAAQWQVLAWAAILDNLEEDLRRQGVAVAKKGQKVPRQRLLEVARHHLPNVKDLTE